MIIPVSTPTKRLKPAHLIVIRLFWAGDTYRDIAAKTDYTPQQVMNILHSPEAKEILQSLQDHSLSSMDEVGAELQLAAPLAIKRKIDLMYSADDAVASRNATDLLHMAGHAPIRNVRIAHTDRSTKRYEGMTDEQLQEAAHKELFGPPPSDDSGPDGRPLN